MGDKDTLRLSAEWAVRGKRPQDVEDSILDCSAATLSTQNFYSILERYEPGFVETLPEVTVSWFSEYLGLAIYDRPEQNARDLGIREYVLTRYFAVLFGEVGPEVSYAAMFEAFLNCHVPPPDHGKVVVDLPASAPAAPGSLAMAAAAGLMTSRPVCVLGASRLSVGERLRFIDAVAALLPFGMRSRLSAATWVNNAFTKHNFRLFFAAADRETGDHLLTWGSGDYPTIDGSAAEGHVAESYLAWLKRDTSRQMARLAEERGPVGFSPDDVTGVLRKLGISTGPEPGGRLRRRPARPAGSRSVPDLITSCATATRNGHRAVLAACLPALRDHLDDQVSSTEREGYQRLIYTHKLLREDLRADGGQRAELYYLLIRLAFDHPIDYQTFCAIEACTGRTERAASPDGGPGGAMHRLLAEAAREVGFTGDLRVVLLALKAVGDDALIPALSSVPMPPATLLALAASQDLSLPHGRAICEIVVADLTRRADELNKNELRSELRRAGYLTATLERLSPGRIKPQVMVLSQFFALVYGPQLDRYAVEDLLEGFEYRVSASVAGAVRKMSAPSEAAEIARLLARIASDRPGRGGNRDGQEINAVHAEPRSARDAAGSWEDLLRTLRT